MPRVTFGIMWRLSLNALAAVLACSSPPADRAADTTPATGSHAELVAQPRLQLAKYLAGCPPTPPNPPVARGVFDVYLGSPRVPSPPSDTAVRAVERMGARILHRFHVDVIRAAMDTAVAHALVRKPEPRALMVRQVAETAPLTVSLVIAYGRALTASDSVFLSELQGAPIVLPRDLRRRTRIFVEAHDSLIPRVVSASGVIGVSVRGEGCGTVGIQEAGLPSARDSAAELAGAPSGVMPKEALTFVRI